MIYCVIHSLYVLDKSSTVTSMRWVIIILRLGTSKFTRAESWGGRAGPRRKRTENSSVIAGVISLNALLCTYRIENERLDARCI